MKRWPIALLSLSAAFAAVPWLGAWGCERSQSASEARQSASAARPEPVTTTRATPPAEAARPIKQRKGGLDVTFLVAADTHLGYATPDREQPEILKQPLGIEQTNLLMIEHMNAIAGKRWPGGIEGQVNVPLGVLLAGDLTEDGGQVDWRMFEALFGRTGKEAPLRYPVFEGDGNHDRNRDWFVREEIARRHGGRFYSFDFDDLHVICLAEAPDDDGLAFLRRDLERVARDVPIVLYFHYPLLGAYSQNNWFGRGNYRDRLELALNEHRVLAIFHGHRHDSGAYRWRGHTVYSVGSPKHAWRSFVVVHVTDVQMTVGAWNYERSKFWWWHQRAIDPGVDLPELKGTSAPVGGDPTPELDLD